MKLLGIVILYYPEEKDIANIQSYGSRVDRLIVWDNTPTLDFQYTFVPNSNIILRRTGKNEGIGKPLNEAVHYALQNNFTHLLTMDQDGYFLPGRFDTFIRIILTNSTPDIALFYPEVGTPSEEDSYLIKDIQATITSGSVYLTDVFKEVGPFRDDFFIDAIDTEFCLRLRRNKYRIVSVANIGMQHTLGHKLQRTFLGGIKIESLNYSPMRTFYIVRNHLITRFIYPEYHNIRYIIKLFVIKRVFAIILIENNKSAKLLALFRGLLAGLKRKTYPFKS